MAHDLGGRLDFAAKMMYFFSKLELIEADKFKSNPIFLL